MRSKPSQMHFWEPPSFSRQLLVRVVNHTLLLVRSVSRFSTKMSVQWGQTLADALLRTFGVFSAVTRARSKSHTTPNTECVTILYKISVQWDKTLTHALLSTTESFSQVTRARSKSHTTPDTECVTILYKNVSSVRSNPHSRTFENLRVFPRQLLVCVVNHTLLLIQSVSRFSAQYQFSEVKPSHTHFWEPSSLSRQLLLCVVNHTLLLIRSVSGFSTKRSVSSGKTLTVALLRTFEFVLGSYSCA